MKENGVQYIFVTTFIKLLEHHSPLMKPNILFNVINTLLEVETPIRLEIIYINTNDYGR